ncbi:MAG: 3-deoxy-8-phosphooctulonate synthase [Planctomycetes bacterium]|nr:3-deoxy-8-phosphooctulonate synthase [Planctomycetota bacterium]
MEPAAAARTARIRGIVVGAGRPLALLAGPCVVEGEAITLRIAERVIAQARAAGLPIVFKASFDKANRTSGKSFRGLGADAALAVLAKVKRTFDVPLVTDIHLPEHAARAAEVVDLLQIPAFLCRQTDLLLAAAAASVATGCAINVKKGQWLSPEEMEHVVRKLRDAGAKDVIVTDRGTFFGYHRLVNDFAAIAIMQRHGVPVCFDATHSVQQPGGAGDKSGGNRRMAPTLARAAVAAGADLVFMEVHENPDAALSDGPNSLPLEVLPRVFAALRTLREQALADPPGSEFDG